MGFVKGGEPQPRESYKGELPSKSEERGWQC